MQKLNINIPFGSGAKSADINKIIAKINELIGVQDSLDATVAQRLSQEAEQRSKLQNDVSNRLSTTEVTVEQVQGTVSNALSILSADSKDLRDELGILAQELKDALDEKVDKDLIDDIIEAINGIKGGEEESDLAQKVASNAAEIEVLKSSATTMKVLLDKVVAVFNAAPYEMHIDIQGDPFFAWGEEKLVVCRVTKIGRDVTSAVTTWRVERNTGELIADTAWNFSNKAKMFDGSIVLTLNAQENDIGSRASATFTFTAFIDDEAVAEGELNF